VGGELCCGKLCVVNCRRVALKASVHKGYKTGSVNLVDEVGTNLDNGRQTDKKKIGSIKNFVFPCPKPKISLLSLIESLKINFEVSIHFEFFR
jgi:hypothetical protein